MSKNNLTIKYLETRYNELKHKPKGNKMNEDKRKAIEAVNVKAYKEAIDYVEPKSTKKLYGVKDTLIGFCETMTGVNDGMMIRNFGMIAKDKSTMIGKFPDNFELWKLGDIDEKTGEYEPDLRKIAEAKDYTE